MGFAQRTRAVKDTIIRAGKNVPTWVLSTFLGAILGVGGTVFVKDHFKPSLIAEIAYADSVTVPQSAPTEFIALLISRLPDGSAQLVNPQRISFKSERDFARIAEGSLIVKVLIMNTGSATAKRIRVGLSMAKDWKLVASPNVEITNQSTGPPTDNYPPYRTIDIERLTIDEVAVLTIMGSCGCASSYRPIKPNKLFVPTNEEKSGYRPILFLTDEDGSALYESAITMKEALEQEKRYVPSTTTGFWAEGLNARSGVSPEITPVDHFSLEVEHQAKDGHTYPVTLSTDRPTILY